MAWMKHLFVVVGMAWIAVGCATSQSLVPDAARELSTKEDFEKFVTCLATNPTPETLAEIRAGGCDAGILPRSLRDSLANRPPSWVREPAASKWRLITPGMREAAGLAVRVLESPVQEQLDRWARQGFEAAPRGAGIRLGASQMLAYASLLEDAVRADGWRYLAYEALILHRKLEAHIEAKKKGFGADGPSACEAEELASLEAELARLERASRAARYVVEYLKAYFRGAPALQVEVSFEETARKIRASILERFPNMEKVNATGFKELLRRELEDAFRKLLPASMMGELGRYVQFGIADDFSQATLKVGTLLSDDPANVGLVTRGGETLAFKTISVQVEPTTGSIELGDVEFGTIGATLIRVVLEALFDAWFQVPGAANATGVGIQEHPLPKWECRMPAAGASECIVTPKELKRVDEWAGRAEAAVGSAVSRIVRGVGPFSLDNEALAVLVETVLAVTARKVTEKVAWCVFVVLPENPIHLPFEPGFLHEAQAEIEGVTALKAGSGAVRMKHAAVSITR